MRIPQLAIVAAVFGVVSAECTVAYEIYQWTDDEGVVHFSQWQPDSDAEDVNKLTLAVTNPPDYDPAEDEYSIRNQAERTNSVWTRLEEKKEARREERLQALERETQYQPYYPRYYPPYAYPAYPRYWRPHPKPYPPHRPLPHRPVQRDNRQPANGFAARRNNGPNRVVTPLPPPRQPPMAVPFEPPRHMIRR